MGARLSRLAGSLTAETAFTVLALARRLQASGKNVVELEIGDSPFPSPPAAKAAAIAAIESDRTGYGPSTGLEALRVAAAEYVRETFGLPAGPENVVVGPGAKVFEQFFCEAFLEPGDGALVFSPHFPTYVPNIERRGARAVFVPLRSERAFRPDPEDVRRFVAEDPSPRAIFLNSPHNPTGGVASLEDLEAIAEIARRHRLAVFSDEPYCHMVWRGRHHSVMALPDMLQHGMAAYTFSKSYSMGGWRLGFAVTAPRVAQAVAKMVNTSLSCVPPFVQEAGLAALRDGTAARDHDMERFRRKVELLTEGLARIEGVRTLEPKATFYVFPDVRELCLRLGVTSHGLAMFLLEGADDAFGVACLGGECFGQAGSGFLRLSCAASDERLRQVLDFLPDALGRTDRLETFLGSRPRYTLDRESPSWTPARQ